MEDSNPTTLFFRYHISIRTGILIKLSLIWAVEKAFIYVSTHTECLVYDNFLTLQINEHWLQGVGSERVAAVLRGTGNHVRLVVARPANPADPNALRPNAPILPSAMLTDRDELEKHLHKNELYSSMGDLGEILPHLEPPPLVHHHQQQSAPLVDQTTSPIHGDEYVAR